MKLFIESGKDKDRDSITARLLLLTAAAVRLPTSRAETQNLWLIVEQLHTSSMAITHAIFDLCVMPEYIEPLRSEAKTALAEENGEWKFSTIKRLRRLDSFLKESQRVNQSTFRKQHTSMV